MTRLRSIIPLRLRSLFSRRQVEQELSEELSCHVDHLTQEYLAQGHTPAEARRRALIDMGGLDQLKEECRDARRVRLLENLGQDARYGLRMLRRAPGFTAIAVLTLALGMGANTAIFSVVDAVLLRPLPYPHASQLVRVFAQQPSQGSALTGASWQDLEAWRARSRSFRQIAGMQEHQLTLTGQGDPAEVDTVVVTADYFPMMQGKPLAGRTLLPGDAPRGAAPVVVLSEPLWRSRFGANPGIVGRSITLDQRSFTVAGVMPAWFHPPRQPRFAGVWIPLAQDPLFRTWMPNWGGHWLGVTGRLQPGVSIQQAQAEMATIAAGLAQQFPATNAGWTVRLVPLRQAVVGNQKTALLVLLGAVGLLLFIACANVASLQLARASTRGRELGVRLALGAGRARIVRQLLTEATLLGLAGGLAGLLLAWGGVRLLNTLLPANLPQVGALTVDGRVLAFAFMLSLAASVLSGLAPALLSVDTRLPLALREGAGRSSSDGQGRRRARGVLAVAEIALAMILLIGAGLLLRSFAALIQVDAGFNPQRIWTAEVSLPRYQYSTPRQWSTFGGQLLRRLKAQPGVQDAALTVPLPLADPPVTLPLTVVDAPPLPPGTRNTADYVSISPGYFHLMGIPLIAGRAFLRRDAVSAPRVAIISEALARRYFPNQNPLGRRLRFGFAPDVNVSREIVGVVADVRDTSLARPPQPMMYVPYAQAPFWGAVMVVKSQLGSAPIVAMMRRQVASIDPDLPVTNFQSLSDGVTATAAQPRFHMLLLGLFALLALALASTGVYGILAFSVSRRTQEMGIRLALGATPGELLRMVTGEAGKLAAAGLATGAVASLLLARFLKGELYGIGATDPWTYLGISMLLASVSLAASWFPARRAARVAPITAIRQDS